MRKLGRGFAALVLLLILAGIPAEAAANQSEKGSIRIVLKDLQNENSRREDLEMRIWKVGSVDENGIPIFDAVYGISQYPEEASAVEQTADRLAGLVKGEPYGKAYADKSGVALFTNVERGIYLVTVPEKNDYGKINPFLLHLPYWDETKESFVYAAEAEPKASPPDSGTSEKPGDSGGSHGTGESSEPGQAGKVQTGDDTRVGLYAVLLLLSLLAAAGLAACLKKRREEERQED